MMRTYIKVTPTMRWLVAAFCAVLVLPGSSCRDRSLGSTPVEPVEDVAVDITLTVYSDGCGTLLETIHLDSEGPVTINVPEADPYSDPPAYYIYAHADGFYTNVGGGANRRTRERAPVRDRVPDGWTLTGTEPLGSSDERRPFSSTGDSSPGGFSSSAIDCPTA